MAIKAIIFDCFGVLVIPAQELLMHDFPNKRSEITDLSLRADYGYITKEEYDRLAAEITGLTVDKFQERYWNRTRNQSVFDWLISLKDTHKFKIGLLSNISVTGIDKFIPVTERKQLFDAVVLSAEVGVTKPSSEIFEMIAERLGVDVSECVMIDDLLENVEGANMAGMKAILYGNTEQAKADLAALLEADNA